MEPMIQEDNSVPIQHEQEPEPQMPYYMDYPPPPPQSQENDIFSNIDKSTWIIAFAVFLLGFFMGKTMQPVILRYS
jgi:hypothetical protein